MFNVFLFHNNSYILYNTYTGSFLELESIQYDFLRFSREDKEIEIFLKYDPDFGYKMIKKGFIVDKNRDEPNAIKEVQKRIDLKDDRIYQLTINPTMNCNFKCWYCYEDHLKGSKMTPDTLKNLKAFIKNIVCSMPNLKSFHISWFGGEPLLFFKTVIKPIMNFTNDLFINSDIRLETDFTTNGFLINDDMIKEFGCYKINNFQITLDGHREFHNNVRFVNEKRGSYDDIVNNILKLCRHGFPVTLRINFTKLNLDSVEFIVGDIESLEPEYRKKMSITFHKVWQEEDLNLGNKVKQLIFFFRERGFNVADGDVPNNLWNSCYADKKNQATINYNGEVYKCTARKFLSEAKEGDLQDDGTIAWNEKYYKRLDSKFKNKPCLSCSILPICNGGCSQLAIENEGKDYCVYGFDEGRKKEVVLSHYLNSLKTTTTPLPVVEENIEELSLV
jgi:uncharacterized protein